MRKQRQHRFIAIALIGMCVVFAANVSAATTFQETEPTSPPLTEVPSGYYEPAMQQGHLERITYQSRRYNADESPVEKEAIVYVPYGYDEDDTETQYNVFYLMHGGGGSATTYLGSENRPTDLVTMIDHMIADGVIEPLIIVAPSIYDNVDSSRDSSLVFYNELENDLMPFVESQYHTYAEGTTAEDFIASRNHRAFGGFSMGSVTTWSVFLNELDYVKYYMPMSGDSWVIGMMGGRNQSEETAQALADAAIDSGYAQDEYFIFSATGSADIAYENLNAQIAAMQEQTEAFTFTEDGPENGNLMYYVVEGNPHNYPYSYEYIYNALQRFFQ